ncbi:hypothetical protein [uncultured Piscinibacter sp.]|uniref:hypothetical protein n=1 Tax=uncultured Piscinibacter sp. TaxID=1131835 RepID=UPI00261F7C05|nr:hypothetical protein [uncultured Piscinibacter sp.]
MRARTQPECHEAKTMCRLAELGRADENNGYRQFFATQFLPASPRGPQSWLAAG